MKFSTNQLIAVAAVLLAALIAANHFAPESYAKVADYVALLFSIFFLNRHDGNPPDDDVGKGDGGAGGLRVIAGGAAVVAALALGGVAACGALKSLDEVNDPSVDAKLAHCRGEARAADYIERTTGNGPMDPRVVYQIYDACKKDAGL